LLRVGGKGGHFLVAYVDPINRGFDQNGQVASSFAVKEGEAGQPKFSPVFYLADLITGCFAAAGMLEALLRRSIEGDILGVIEG
jgi:crotonobetainyl-CoA:carnitine CoA-transferase CaiB-like acyl-CoA transferase